MDLPSKEALKDELLRCLGSQLEAAERTHRATIDAATHEEAKPENDKDTRALEQSYLARGQATRVEELRAQVTQVRRMLIGPLDEDAPAAMGALVVVDEDERRLVLFLAPGGGGTALANASVQVVTHQSALGGAILGKRAGDDCETNIGGRLRELRVHRVV